MEFFVKLYEYMKRFDFKIKKKKYSKKKKTNFSIYNNYSVQATPQII